MYQKMYIVLSVLIVAFGIDASSVSRRSSDAETCPLIHAKPQKECYGEISECWSPNQFDVDCDNGAGICCFDGCVNVCGPPEVCKTEFVTRYEDVTKVMCNLVEQPPICTSRTETDCSTDCEIVEEIVPTLIENDVCVTVTDTVCEPFSEEVCVFENSDVTSCPVVPLKSAWECEGLPHSDCWSPGVPDLDCEHAGLCCFDGCFNRCLKEKRCTIEKVPDCHQVEVPDCQDVIVTECNDFPMDAKVAVTTTTCVKTDQECIKMPQEVCEDVVVQECQDVVQKECRVEQVPVEKERLVEECKSVVVPDCKNIFEKKCTGVKGDSYFPYVCQKVPKEVCEDRVENQCQQVAKKVLETESKEICEDVARPSCLDVTKHECRQVEQEKCTEKVDEKCDSVITYKDDRVVFNKCLKVTKQVCAPKFKEECTTVEKEVCPECTNKIVTNERCNDVPRQSCHKESITVEKVIPKEICTNVCVPRVEEDCYPAEPKEVCNNIVKQMSYQVPVLKC